MVKKKEGALKTSDKQVEEFKEMTKNIGKRKKQILKKDNQVKRCKKNNLMEVPEPPKTGEKTNSFLDFKKRMSRFNLPKIKLPEHKESELKPKKIKEDKKKCLEIKHPVIQRFFRVHEKKEPKKEKIVMKTIPSLEKHEIFEKLKMLEDKPGKSKEEFEELQRIKNSFYGEKKGIKNTFSSNSGGSGEIIESGKEEKGEEFSAKIVKLVSKINADEKKRREMEERKKRFEENKKLGKSKKTFSSLFSRIRPKREEIVIEKIHHADKNKIFENLKRLDEKIDKNKEEIYDRMILGLAESKRMIEAEREEIKKPMIELLAESIDKLDEKDREIKKELYEELQRIKNTFYGEKKEILNIISSNSEESRKRIEAEKEKLKDEFLIKIANLRNKINAEEKKTRELKERKKELEENSEFNGSKKTFSSLFSNPGSSYKENEPKPKKIKELDTEKGGDIALEIFGKRVEELKEITGNIGKRKKQILNKDKKVDKSWKNKKIPAPKPQKIEEKTNSFLDFKKRMSRFNLPKIKLPEHKESELKPKKIKESNIEKISPEVHDVIQTTAPEVLHSSEHRKLHFDLSNSSNERDIALEIFGKRVEELKEMTENLGKRKEQILKKNNQSEEYKENKKMQFPEPQKIEEKTNSFFDFKKKMSRFNLPKIKLPEHKESEPKPTKIREYSHVANLGEENIIGSMPEIPKFPDLELLKYSVDKQENFSNFRETEKIDSFENKQFSASKKFTREIETPGNYEKSIKNLIAPKIISKSDLEFEETIQKSIKKGRDDAENKNQLKKKHIDSGIIQVFSTTSKKPIYIGEQDFKDVSEEIEQAKKNVYNLEKSFSEKVQTEKKEHEKIGKILEDAEYITNKFSKINSGMLGKIKE